MWKVNVIEHIICPVLRQLDLRGQFSFRDTPVDMIHFGLPVVLVNDAGVVQREIAVKHLAVLFMRFNALRWEFNHSNFAHKNA